MKITYDPDVDALNRFNFNVLTIQLFNEAKAQLEGVGS